jgi:hypothetical protein
LVVAGGFAVVVLPGRAVAALAGLAAAALAVAADAAGAASPISATVAITMPGRRPRLPRPARPPANKLCRPAPLAARSVTRMSTHSRALYLPTLALPPVTRSMVAIGPLIGWPQVRLRPCGWRLRPMLASIGLWRPRRRHCLHAGPLEVRAMDVTEAQAVTDLLRWVLRLARPDGDPVTDERFCEAALLLSRLSRGAAGTGLRPRADCPPGGAPCRKPSTGAAVHRHRCLSPRSHQS